MKILIASDSFKGSLSSKAVGEIISEEARITFPNAEVLSASIADGGEGTVNALIDGCGGQIYKAKIQGPLFEYIEAEYGILSSGEAVIESASACGLPLIPPNMRNPMKTTSAGVGQLIKVALINGARRIIVGLGGSGTIDGGMGALQSLGVVFSDQEGERLLGIGESLGKVKKIDISGIIPQLKENIEIVLLVDVRNPLTGPNGAARSFGPQKGATEDMVSVLDAGLDSFANIAINEAIPSMNIRAGLDSESNGNQKKEQHMHEQWTGAGAAGGLCGGLFGVLRSCGVKISVKNGGRIVLKFEKATFTETHLAALLMAVVGNMVEFSKATNGISYSRQQHHIEIWFGNFALGQQFQSKVKDELHNTLSSKILQCSFDECTIQYMKNQ
ncbi:MAG: glycerate 2-kinase [Streblomastix strix]|uniref:Glycerate 2-kinase n=1 Tax=Streblomastix strix TaxID=222440 RepID=A0A5J4V001_9EUKA|nr:MAG: glycerate 2-kinase [Streblomastix strix]